MSVRAPQLPGPSSVPSRRIVVHGRCVGAGSTDAASTSGERTSGRDSPGPRRSCEPEPPAVGADPLRQRRLGREEEPARGEHVLRLVVREDGLEDGVAAHGHVGERDVRHDGRDGEDRERRPSRRRRPTPASGVDHGEEPHAEEREVDREDAGDEPPVDRDDPGQPDGAGEHHGEEDSRRAEEQQTPSAARPRAAGRAPARASRGTPPGSAGSVCAPTSRPMIERPDEPLSAAAGT